MDRAKEFGSCLEVLEAQTYQTLELESMSEQVTAALADGARMLCGNEKGDIFMLMGKDVMKLASTSSREAVKQLAWVGKDKCISRHQRGPCRLWDLVKGRESAVFDAGERPDWDSETALALSADGRAVIGSFDGDLRLWDISQLKQIALVKAHNEGILCICLAGEKCITGSLDCTVKVWDLSTLQPLATLQGHSDHVTCLAITSKGQCLSGSLDRTVRIWDLSTYTEVGCYKGHQKPISFLQEIDRDRCISRYQARNCFDRETEVRVWSLSDLSDLYQIEGKCWDQQKDLLYIGTPTGLTILNLQTYEITGTVELIGNFAFVHYFEGKCACVTGGLVTFVDVDEYREVHELSGHESTVNGVLPCGANRAISWSSDQTLKVWDVSKHQPLAVLRGHSGEVNCAAVTADGRCVSGDSGGCLKVWDLSHLAEVSADMKHPRAVQLVAVTSSKAISADESGTMFVWKLADYMKAGELQGHTNRVSCITFASDEIAITGSHDCTLRVWNVNECTALNTLNVSWPDITAVTIVSGSRCLPASGDTNVLVWDFAKKDKSPERFIRHTRKVWTVAVVGEKCVSGSEACEMCVWSADHCQQEAKFMFAAPVRQIVPINESQFVSTHADGKVRVWDEYRELATFKEHHSGAITNFTRLEDCQFASTGENENTVKVWDLGQLSSCLSACGSREVLEREISENKPVLAQYRSRIPDMKTGKRLPQSMRSMLFRPYFFNALHFCAYFNHPKLLTEYLEEGVPLVHGVCGSPLTIALDRGTTECVDAILDHLITVASHDYAWKSFETIVEDLLHLLGCGSTKLEDFFGVFFQRPSQKLQSFITPYFALPYVAFATHPYVNEFDLFPNAYSESGEDLVKFTTSLINWNFVAGSKKSIEMLMAVVNCEDKRVLLTDFFRTIIEQKWTNCFPFTFSVALAYGAMLGCLMGTINLGSRAMCIAYLVLNIGFTLYESSQMLAMRLRYFTEGWNIVDIVRCTLSIVWASCLLAGYQMERVLILIVVLLDFIRGFTHFRSFRMTRIFVYMTFTVVAEVYSFLIILAYSVFAFGIFTSVLIGEQSLSETWKKAYNMAMGNFDTSGYGALEWIVFTGATVTNVVVMMNLLISILGEAYEKAQMTMLENDLHMQASLLLEYETLMVWRRNVVSKTWIVTCRRADGGQDQVEWSGKVLQIVNSLSTGLSRVETEIAGKIGNVESRVKGIDARMGAIDELKGKMAILDVQVASVEEIKSKVAGIEDLKTKVVGIENKVNSLGEKLDAVLGFLQARS